MAEIRPTALVTGARLAGFIEADMTAPSKARYDKLVADGLTVIRRWSRPEEVARIAVILATGGLPYTSGHAIG
jgi:hypothetical protein